MGNVHHAVLITAIFLLPAVTSAAAELEIKRLPGGAIRADIGYGVIVNKGSSLERTIYLINDHTAPIYVLGGRLKIAYDSKKRRLVYRIVTDLRAKTAIKAYQVNYSIYDVFDEHIITLGAREIKDVTERVPFTGEATFNDYREKSVEALTTFVFLRRARRGDGTVWKARIDEISSVAASKLRRESIVIEEEKEEKR
ncbi:MAG: hypothetical protein ACE5I9_10970 [Candidatus Methylomirabilales bacterium]